MITQTLIYLYNFNNKVFSETVGINITNFLAKYTMQSWHCVRQQCTSKALAYQVTNMIVFLYLTSALTRYLSILFLLVLTLVRYAHSVDNLFKVRYHLKM